MKRIIVMMAALLVTAFGASAQGFLNIRVEGGASFNFGKVMSEGKSAFGSKNLTGYHAGAFIDIPIGNMFVGSGLKFSMKGVQSEIKLGKLALGAQKFSLHYLEVPLNFGYKFNVSPLFAVALQTGPYVAFALSGTVQTGSTLQNLGKSFNVFKEGATQIGEYFKARRYDVGWGLAARAYVSRYYVTAGFDFGFLNVLNNSTDKEDVLSSLKDQFFNLKNKQFYIGLGVTF